MRYVSLTMQYVFYCRSVLFLCKKIQNNEKTDKNTIGYDSRNP